MGGCPGDTNVITTEADGTNLSSSYEAFDEKASTFVIDVRGGRTNKSQPWSGLLHVILMLSSMVISRGMMFQHNDHRVCGRPIAKVAMDASTCLRLLQIADMYKISDRFGRVSCPRS